MPDWAAEGLLEGLGEEERAGRIRLLDELLAEGVDYDELCHAVREQRLALVVVERILGGGTPKYSLRDAAEKAGRDLDWLIRSRQALGLATGDPDVPLLTEREFEGLSLGRQMDESGLPDEALLEIYRALGGAMARYTDSLRIIVTEALLEAGGTEYDIAARFRAWMEVAMPMFGPALELTGRAHLLQHLRQDILTYEELRSGRLRMTAEIAVAFVDVVGFTALGEELPEEELGSIASRLAAAANDVAQPPVRLVKSIGDAVMLVSAEPAPLVEAVLTLVEGHPELPELRGAVAYGPAVNRDGDWYGSIVNLAARLCDRARPGSVLVPEDLRDSLDAARFSCSEAGAKRLKGLSSPVATLRVRRPAGP